MAKRKEFIQDLVGALRMAGVSEDENMIEKSLYDKIVLLMPIVSVEAMIVNDDKEILFLKRNNPPVKGEWWFTGGRIRKGETFEEALRREVKEETELDIDILGFIGVYNRIFPERHDIVLDFLCKCKNKTIVLNTEHSEYKFYKKIPSNIHLYLRKAIKDSGRCARDSCRWKLKAAM